MTKPELTVLKIGGNVVDDEKTLHSVLTDFAALEGKKILVHGGGKIADMICEKLNITPQKVEGRRLTDAPTLDVVTMVYAGLINKKIVARLQRLECNALGLTGADLNVLLAHKRAKGNIDYGFAGDIDSVNVKSLSALLKIADTIVLAPITHDGKGQLLNTNADTIATVTAIAMSKRYETTLKFCFEKKGVLSDPADDDSVIPTIQYEEYQAYKASGAIYAGMIPKLDNAFGALQKGVGRVVICGPDGIQVSASSVGTRLVK